MSRSYISKQLLTSSINIPTDRLRGDINETILRQIKKRFEGTCNQDGFIEKGSIEITNRSLGEMKTINNKSYIVVVFADHGSRYLSKIYSDEWMNNQGFYDSTFYQTNLNTINYV